MTRTDKRNSMKAHWLVAALLTANAAALASAPALQDQPQIETYSINTSGAPVLAGNAGSVLEDDNIKHVAIKMDTNDDEVVFVFVRLWIEAPENPDGSTVGQATVDGLVDMHENLQRPDVAFAGDVDLPPGLTLDSPPNVELGIEPERISAFLTSYMSNASLESYGFQHNPNQQPWRLTKLPTSVEDQAAEANAWSKDYVWPFQNEPHVLHISALLKSTFVQSLWHQYGDVASGLLSAEALAEFINEWVTANIAIHVVVIDKKNPSQKKIKFKNKLFIRRLSWKQVYSIQTSSPMEPAPTWFPTALIAAVHVAEEGAVMNVPTNDKVSDLRLVWQKPNAPGQFIILPQLRSSYDTMRPTFAIPSGLQQLLAPYGPVSLGYLMMPDDKPLDSNLLLYNWGGPGGIVVYTTKSTSTQQD